MKSEPIGNKPAFPSPIDVQHGWDPEYGMTYREWLIGMIASGYHAQPDNTYYDNKCGKTLDEWRVEVDQLDAKYFIRRADAILAALDAEKETAHDRT
jgi:hypothetical protein